MAFFVSCSKHPPINKQKHISRFIKDEFIASAPPIAIDQDLNYVTIWNGDSLSSFTKIYDDSQNLTIGSWGYAMCKTTYSDLTHSKISEHRYYGLDSTLIISKYGYAIRQISLGENYREHKYFDNNENLMIPQGKGAAIKRTVDDIRGNTISIESYGPDQELINDEMNGGYAIWKMKYDNENNKIEESYWNSNGNLFFYDYYGFAYRKTRYNDYEKVLIDSLFSADSTYLGYKIITYDLLEPLTNDKGYTHQIRLRNVTIEKGY